MDRTTNPIGWRAQVERFGVISLMLVVFTIPLSIAFSLSMFPLLALLAWLFSGGFKDFPTLLRAAKWLLFREACLTQGLVVWFLTINLFNSFLFAGRDGTMFVLLAAVICHPAKESFLGSFKMAVHEEIASKSTEQQ